MLGGAHPALVCSRRRHPVVPAIVLAGFLAADRLEWPAGILVADRLCFGSHFPFQAVLGPTSVALLAALWFRPRTAALACVPLAINLWRSPASPGPSRRCRPVARGWSAHLANVHVDNTGCRSGCWNCSVKEPRTFSTSPELARRGVRRRGRASGLFSFAFGLGTPRQPAGACPTVRAPLKETRFPARSFGRAHHRGRIDVRRRNSAPHRRSPPGSSAGRRFHPAETELLAETAEELASAYEPIVLCGELQRDPSGHARSATLLSSVARLRGRPPE